jgi:hypothetical protein
MRRPSLRRIESARAAIPVLALVLTACGSTSGDGGTTPMAGAAALGPADAGMDSGPGTVLPLAPGRPSSVPFRPPEPDAGMTAPTDAGVDAGPATSLGARCVSDRDCEEPLTCLEVNENVGAGEGPPRGLCTVKCSEGSTVCADLGGACVDLTYSGNLDSQYCLETCSFGPGDQSAFTDDKCHAREEFSCYPLSAGPTCVPNCNGDMDCGTRICNPGTGMCGNTTPPGGAIGTKCEPGASGDACHGYCQSYTLPADAGVTGVCMEDCTWGRLATCGWTGAGPAQAACFLFPTSVLDAGGPGYGDVGNCVQLCDCNSQCSHPGFVCEPLGDADYEAYWGRKGLCVLKGPAGDLPACPATL